MDPVTTDLRNMNSLAMGSLEFPARCSQPQRAASLIRFRQKRKERCFDKKVRYGVRQEVALRMHRNKGQFTSAKKQDSANSGGKDQDSGQDDSQSKTAHADKCIWFPAGMLQMHGKIEGVALQSWSFYAGILTTLVM
ncbi:hypothetical protein RIF29_14618 [Crotalaria pallida]|uniref:CCT domain-containing protein n=1 Tax=Crotalaria pallida TaxID=3830 RepID=A0AAN9IBT6_CROPI